MKIKVCGMKYMDNILSVAGLYPDYMGFIFYERSPRHFSGPLPQLPESVKKTGVFVNESLAQVIEMIRQYDLKAVQLHGDETAGYCGELKGLAGPGIEIIKAFSMSSDFDFKLLGPYSGFCDYFLFDTKGRERGGNGSLFDWNILKGYPLEKPFILSGGIGLSAFPLLDEFLKDPVAKHCYAIDVNSKFESEPGLKRIEELKVFFKQIENKN